MPFSSREDDPLLGQINFANQDILEVGCGRGDFALRYLTGARSLLALDPNAEAIDFLKTQRAAFPPQQRVEFYTGNIIDFPLRPASLDIAIFSHSF